ncbi:putative DD41D transposase [Trichonephila clavipes]|nr:putative DD41D transposase [Trichonephila clavipes]
MITNFFIPELNNHDVQELWFQQDGVAVVAEWYRYRTVACFVTGSSPVPLKTRRVEWAAMHSLVYADNPQTLDHLEDNIRHVIADIRPQMLEKVIENWTSRLDYIRASRGSPIPEIIFKM